MDQEPGIWEQMLEERRSLTIELGGILPLEQLLERTGGDGYLSVILLDRVITKLGSLPAVDTRVVESLFTMDLAYLQDLYQKINTIDMPVHDYPCTGLYRANTFRTE